MKWKAIETEEGEARVIDVTTDRVMVIARINSEPFQGMEIAKLIADAPELRLNCLAMMGIMNQFKRQIDDVMKYTVIKTEDRINDTYDLDKL